MSMKQRFSGFRVKEYATEIEYISVLFEMRLRYIENV